VQEPFAIVVAPLADWLTPTMSVDAGDRNYLVSERISTTLFVATRPTTPTTPDSDKLGNRHAKSLRQPEKLQVGGVTNSPFDPAHVATAKTRRIRQGFL
jgi:hypothetical protein